MGQYYVPVNLDKRQYLSPHKFGDGMKLLELGCSMNGTMTGLAILLADGNNRGGGDLRSDDPIIGSWAGDRIVLAGDYADEGKFLDDMAELDVEDENTPNAERTLYSYAQDGFEDITGKVMKAMMADQYVGPDVRCALERGIGWDEDEETERQALIEHACKLGLRSSEGEQQSKELRPDMVIVHKS